jgi:hypothetical protein
MQSPVRSPAQRLDLWNRSGRLISYCSIARPDHVSAARTNRVGDGGSSMCRHAGREARRASHSAMLEAMRVEWSGDTACAVRSSVALPHSFAVRRCMRIGRRREGQTLLPLSCDLTSSVVDVVHYARRVSRPRGEKETGGSRCRCCARPDRVEPRLGPVAIPSWLATTHIVCYALTMDPTTLWGIPFLSLHLPQDHSFVRKSGLDVCMASVDMIRVDRRLRGLSLCARSASVFQGRRKRALNNMPRHLTRYQASSWRYSVWS